MRLISPHHYRRCLAASNIRTEDATAAFSDSTSPHQILPMVDKDDHETLEKALQIEEGKDQVTLFTCTPYGVNSHRLLVRGIRVPYNGEEDATESVTDSMVKAIQNYYMLYLILGLSITILVIILLRFLSKRKAHKE